MSRYHFLRTSRWIGLAVVVVVVSVACVFLGIWQWNRHEDRAAGNDLVNTNYDLPTEPIGEVVDDDVPTGLVWRSVDVVGSYVGAQVLVRNRPVDGTNAARVLAVLRTAADGGAARQDDDGGRLVVVDRGWVQLGDGELVVPEYPDGEVTVVGRLREAEEPDSRTAPAGNVYRIEPATVAAAAGVDEASLLDGYLLASAEDGEPADGLLAMPRPETTPGSHLSYAFQWWVFAVGALVGYVILARKEAAETGGAAPALPERTPRRRSDAEEEDALIDAQLHTP